MRYEPAFPIDTECAARLDDAPPVGELPQAEIRGSGPLVVFYGDAPPIPPRWLVRGLLPESQVAIVSGQFSAGKTTLCSDLSYSVMTGEPFAGREIVRTGAVLWLGAEGASEVDIRLKAAALHRGGDDMLGRLPFARQADDVPVLTASDAYERLVAIVSAAKVGLAERFPEVDLALIVVDTLASAAGFQDENSASETQRVMILLRRLSDAAGALVVVVDHHGKAAETGVRGSSAKSGAADAILAALADKDAEGEISNRRLAVVKLRSGIMGETFPFTLKPIAVDEWGNTSCGVEWQGPAGKAERHAKPAWSGNARVFRAAMVHAMLDHGERKRPFGDEGPEVKAVKLDDVRGEFYARYAAETQDAKKKAFRRMIAECVARNLIASRESGGTDWLWFMDEIAAREAEPNP